MGYIIIWVGGSLHKQLKHLCDKYGLAWLRISMSYSRYTNLSQKLNSDLAWKVMDGIKDVILKSVKCNCDKPSALEDG